MPPQGAPPKAINAAPPNTLSHIRSLLWALLESGGLSVLSLATIIFLARLLGPTEIGAAGIAIAVLQILSIVVELPFHDAVVQRKDLSEDHLHVVFWTSLILGVVLSAACWIFAGSLASRFDAPQIAPVLGWMSLMLVLNGSTAALVALYRRTMDFKSVAQRTLYGRLFGTLLAIVLAVAGAGIWSFVAQQLVASAFGAALLWRRANYRPALRWSWQAARELLAFGLPSFGTMLLWHAQTRLFTVALGLIFDTTVVGYFNIATRLAETSRGILSTAFYNVSLSVFSRCQDQRPSLRRNFLQASRLVTLATLPLFAGLLACADPLVSLLLGAEWLPAVPLVRLMAFDAMLMVLGEFYPTAFSAVGRPQLNMIPHGVSAVAAFAGLFTIAGGDPILAVALWATRNLITLPIQYVMLKRILGCSFKEQIDITLVPLAASVLMAAMVLAVQSQWLAQAGAVLQLAVSVALGVVAYAAAVYALRPALMDEIRTLALSALSATAAREPSR